MTSISSLTSSTSNTYRSSLDKNNDGIVSADEFSAGSGLSSSGSSSLSTDDSASGSSSAATQLSSMLAAMMLQMSGTDAQDSGSGEASDGGKASALSVSTLDTDGDGTVSATEFAAAKPDDVSDDMSSELFSSLDADGNGSLDESELSASQNGAPPPPAGGPPPSGSDDDSSSTSSLDTDGDGVISAAEWAAAQPDDVSDDMSAELFSALDADENGSLDETELAATRNGPPPPPPAGTEETAASEDSATTSETDADDLLAKLQELTQQYLADFSDETDTATSLLSV